MEANNTHTDLSVSEEHMTVPAAPQTDTAMAELDKVRSILFGEQIRSTEDRLAKLENSLLDKLKSVQDRIEARLDEIDKKLVDRKKDIDTLETNLGDHKKAIADELKKVDEALRETIVSAASTVAQDFQEKTDALSQALEDSTGQLQKAKVDRHKLAALLSQLAEGLGD